MNQKPLALVTGASGFVGRVLCQFLKEKGIRVRALMRCKKEGPWDEVVSGNIIEPLPDKTMHGVSTVFHLAAKAHALDEKRQDESVYYKINTEGTRKLLEMAQAEGVRCFVFFSSVKAMGEGGFVCVDENAVISPKTAYGRSKLEAEHLVLEGGYVPHPVVLRLSMVYGPSPKGNLPRMIKAVNNGQFPPIKDVKNRRSMVHVNDVVNAAILAAEKHEAANNTFILTDGQVYSTRQIYDWICECLGRPVPSCYVPSPVLKILALAGDAIGTLRGKRFIFDSDTMGKLIGSACYSSKLIEKELGFKAKRNLHESLGEIVSTLNLV